jgi:hypothetical protein
MTCGSGDLPTKPSNWSRTRLDEQRRSHNEPSIIRTEHCTRDAAPPQTVAPQTVTALWRREAIKQSDRAVTTPISGFTYVELYMYAGLTTDELGD